MANFIQRVIFALSVCSLVFCQNNGNDVTTRCPQNLAQTTAMRLFHDTCYQFVSEEKYWHQARDHCLRNGGRLVKVNDPETNQFIVDALNGLWWRNNGVWIGMHDIDVELHWQWTGYQLHENERVLWTNWGRGHPRALWHGIRDCVRMVRGDGWKWHETVCSGLRWHYRFICEYNAGPVVRVASPATNNPPIALNRQLVNFHEEHHEEEADREDDMEMDDEEEELSDELQLAAAVRSSETQENRLSTGALGWIFGCLLFCTIAVVIIFLLLRRRRRRIHGAEIPFDDGHCAKASKDKEPFDGFTEAASFRPKAKANIYVDANFRGHVTTSRLVVLKPDPEMSKDEEEGAGCGGRCLVDDAEMRGMEKEEEADGNIYAEIAERIDDDNGNIYEDLKDVRMQQV